MYELFDGNMFNGSIRKPMRIQPLFEWACSGPFQCLQMCIRAYTRVPWRRLLFPDIEINQGVRGCFREADQQRLDRCERAPVAQASWAGPSEVS